MLNNDSLIGHENMTQQHQYESDSYYLLHTEYAITYLRLLYKRRRFAAVLFGRFSPSTGSLVMWEHSR
jgi:hypothetical protein